jgi:hypothetical protein
MNTWRLLLAIVACTLLVVTAGGCSPTPTSPVPPADNTLLTTGGSEGVIFPGRDWVPTLEEVQTLEAQLDDYLSQHQAAFDASKPPIEERLPEYKRQYWGVIRDDKRVIFANFFCDPMHYEWQVQKVAVEDGGDCYFQIQYDVETGTFFNLYVNGSS